MDRTEILVMAGFGALLLLGLFLGLRRRANFKARAAAYASSHGWTAMPNQEEKLAALLEEMIPDESWSTDRVLLGEPAPRNLYLFGYQAGTKHGSASRRTTGTACLAVHTGLACTSSVTIVPRTPVLVQLLDDRVAVGSSEFRDRWAVMCRDAHIAEAFLSPTVENIMMGHARHPGWFITVVIQGHQVMAYSFWAVKDDEWDYLVDLTRMLREAAEATAPRSAW
jgi:hypothetical protein